MIVFAPVLPWPAVVGLGLLTGGLGLLSLVNRTRGALLRLSVFALLAGLLSGPQWTIAATKPLPDIALVLVDHSRSMDIGGRLALAARALASLRASAGPTQLEIAEIPATDTGGTQLTAAMELALGSIPKNQLAGIIAVTDGEAPPPAIAGRVPFTALITARGEETDRELHLDNAPSYGLVGKNQDLTFTTLDHGVEDAGAAAQATITEDGKTVAVVQARIGVPITVSLPVPHAGANIVAATVVGLPGEVSLINDQAIFTLTGIHKRLNVLLISGSPGQGERAWRLLLKSDPAVELIHFTILRSPGEAIDAAPQDLALIPFPIHELFEDDIDKFDLIILDGFDATSLLPADYLGNIANYVRRGGALLTEAGPEFSGPDSLAYSPLGVVLPASPSARTLDQSFVPAITPLGARHPVTAPFAAMSLAPWYRMEVATPRAGDVLMTGPGQLPLLILADAGAGRSAILLSDQLWLWTRGGPHTGPALPLLRRLVHWLLREPDLEAESLSARITDGRLLITRHSLSQSIPGALTVTAPDGTSLHPILTQTAPGTFTASQAISPATGIWKISAAGLTTYVAASESNAQEYVDLAATGANLRNIAHGVIWLGQTEAPPLSSLILPRHAAQIIGAKAVPLLPALPTLALVLGLVVASWWRENRA